jgi:pilus assembly protein CpaB
MKEKITLAVSLLMGFAALFLTTRYIRQKENELNKRMEEIYAGARKVQVVVAAGTIPAGTVLTQKDLALDSVFESAAGSHAVLRDDANTVLGKKTVFPLRRGEVVSWSFIEGGAPAVGGLSSQITPGLRAVSLPIGGAQAVSGMVRPSDRIDVLGTFAFPSKTRPDIMENVTLTLLQDVTVLATGQTTTRQLAAERGQRAGGASSGYSTVTLEVSAEEAELLVFAQQMRGSLTLALRNPGDVTWKRDLPSVNFDHIQTALPDINLQRQRDIRHKTNL